MALRDLDIDIDLEVDGSELATVNSQIDALIAKLSFFDDDINIDVNLHDNGALAQIQLLQQQTGQLDNNTIDINAILDNAEIMAQLQALQQQINNVDNDDITIDVHAEYAETLAQLQHLEQQVNSLDANDVFIDVDIEAHTNDILALRAHLRMLELQARNINVDLDTAGAHAQLAILQAHINGIRGPNLNVGGGFNISNMLSPNLFGMGVKLTAILIALPAIASLAQVAVGVIGALGVAIGVVAGGLLGLASAATIAFGGIMGVGMLAMSTITPLYEENAKLTAQQVELKKQTDSVVSGWNDLKEAMQPAMFDVVSSGAKAVNTALGASQPILQAASKAVAGLMDNLNASFKGAEMQNFFDYLQRSIGPLTMNIGNGLGNAFKGILNTMTALEPLTSWMGQGFENMMGRFSNWTAGLQGSEKMTAFIDYVKVNLPKLGSIIGDATDGIVNFFAAFSGSASGGFDWMSDLMADFSNWSANLGNNEGFQKMLSDISRDGPKVAEVIGNVTTNIMDATAALSSFGDGAVWDFLTDMTSGKNIPKLDFAEIFKGGALGMGLDALGIDINWSKILGLDSLGKLASDIGSKISSLFNNLGSDIYQAIQGSNMPSFLKDGLSKMFEGFDMTLPDAAVDNMVQGAMTQVENAFNGGGSKPFEAELSLFQGKEIEVDVGANTTKADADIEGVGKNSKVEVKAGADTTQAQADMKNIEADKIEAKVSADTAQAQSQLNSMKATPIKIKADSSAIAASIQNMPNARVKVTADTASLTNSIGNLPDARISLRADTIKITNNIAPVNVPANLSSINTSGLGPVKLPVTPMFAGGGSGINFNWPPMPKFTFPSLPKFSWPAMPKFSWPPMPKFSWPPMPKFSWPPFPRFSWPPMPTVKVNVSGAGANGSHASGLGRVPFDGYMGELHKNESVLTASQSQGLRDAGVLRGDGTSPAVDLSAVASSAPVVSGSGTNAQVTNHNSVTIVVQGGGDAQSTATSVREEIENWFASVQDVMPPIMEV